MTPISSATVDGISTHALREEGDRQHRPLRALWRHFYPRPPRGGRRTTVRSRARLAGISTHALREEGDATIRSRVFASELFLPTPSARRATGGSPAKSSQAKFLPTPSARRATGGRQQRRPCVRISTHALREEGDSKCAIKQKLFSGSICTIRYSPRKKRAVFVQAALSLERSLHV